MVLRRVFRSSLFRLATQNFFLSYEVASYVPGVHFRAVLSSLSTSGTRHPPFCPFPFHKSVRCHSDEADGIPPGNSIEILNEAEDRDVYFVVSFGPMGFRLSNGFQIMGPCVLFPRGAFCWRVSSPTDITPESLSLFSLLEPRLDVLILGDGDGTTLWDKGPVLEYCRRVGLQIEILRTEQAISTYNFLSSEQRMVAAALIPPENLTLFTPELLVDEDTFDMEALNSTIDDASPDDPSHPKNWPRWGDMLLDVDMSVKMGKPLSVMEAKEIRYTQSLTEAEVAAMEDRWDEDGKRILTELDLHHKAQLAEDYMKAVKTGEITQRIVADAAGDIPLNPDYNSLMRDEILPSLEYSKRLRKKFERLYDVDYIDKEWERRKLEKEKQKLLGEDFKDDK